MVFVKLYHLEVCRQKDSDSDEFMDLSPTPTTSAPFSLRIYGLQIYHRCFKLIAAIDRTRIIGATYVQ